MSQPERLGARRSTLFGVAAAFLAGVLVAALFVPERDVIESAAVTAGGGPAELDAEGFPETTVDPAGSDGATAGGDESAAQGAGAVPGATVGPVGTGGGTTGGGTTGDSQRGGPSGGGAAGGATAPGVTADKVTIGVGVPDLSVIAALGPGYDAGNAEEHVEGILAQLREDGRLPVHGRDIEPVYSSYNILSEDEQRATCENFGVDNTVFAVIAIHNFGAGNECTAREFGLPTFTSDGSSDAVHARAYPNLFTMQMTGDRMLRNYVAWANEAGFLTNKRIGIYSSNDPEAAAVVEENVIKPLEALGHDIVAHVETSQTEAATGGPRDSIAVQQFSTNRVDVAILLVSAVAKTNFFNQAQTQGYKPLYLENDIGFSTTDTATSTYPPAQFDKTPAFTGMRFGEGNSGVPEPAEAQWCRAAIKAQTGNDIPRQGRDAEYIAANQACDEIMVVLHALEQAGPGLTRASFIASVETIRGMGMGIHNDVTFTRERHDGVSIWRQIRWARGCTCWRVDGDKRPLLVG